MKVKFTAKYENKEDGLKAYAFETSDFIEIIFDTYFLNIFRLDCVKGEWKIFDRCIEENYTVFEDVTHLFDLDDIIKQMKEIENEIPCEQKEYEEFLQVQYERVGNMLGATNKGEYYRAIEMLVEMTGETENKVMNILYYSHDSQYSNKGLIEIADLINSNK